MADNAGNSTARAHENDASGEEGTSCGRHAPGEASPQMTIRVFLSYSHKDNADDRLRSSVQDAVDALNLEGQDYRLSLFVDGAVIKPGDLWRNVIEENLGATSIFIPVITPSYCRSEWCCYEFEHFDDVASASGRAWRYLPVFWEDVPDDLRQTSRFNEKVYKQAKDIQGAEVAFLVAMRSEQRQRIHDLIAGEIEACLRRAVRELMDAAPFTDAAQSASDEQVATRLPDAVRDGYGEGSRSARPGTLPRHGLRIAVEAPRLEPAGFSLDDLLAMLQSCGAFGDEATTSEQLRRTLLPTSVNSLVGDPARLAQTLCDDSGLRCRAMLRRCAGFVPNLNEGMLLATADYLFSWMERHTQRQDGSPTPLAASVRRVHRLCQRYASGNAGRTLLVLVLLALLDPPLTERVLTCPDTKELFPRPWLG